MKDELWDDMMTLPKGTQAKLTEISLRMSGEHHGRYFGLGNWILATLVAINGAAILALSNLEIGILQGMLPSAGLFVLGIISAVVSGFCHKGELDRLSVVRFYDGLFTEQNIPPVLRAERLNHVRRSRRLSTCSIWLNIFALASFAAGCALVGYEIAKYDGDDGKAGPRSSLNDRPAPAR